MWTRRIRGGKQSLDKHTLVGGGKRQGGFENPHPCLGPCVRHSLERHFTRIDRDARYLESAVSSV